MLRRVLLILMCLLLVGCNNNSLKVMNNNLPNSISSDTDQGDSLYSKVMSYELLPLSDEDFVVTYNSVRINKDTNYIEIVNKLGYPEDHEAFNYGFISGNSDYRRWNLSYPLHEKPEIRMIVLSERDYSGEVVSDGNGYIVGIIFESYKTNKGLQVGDSIDKVLKLYGRPESFEPSTETENKLYKMRYTREGSHIDVTLNEEKNTVQYIFIDYYMEKSIKDQGLED